MCADWDRAGLVQAREQVTALFTDQERHRAPTVRTTWFSRWVSVPGVRRT